MEEWQAVARQQDVDVAQPVTQTTCATKVYM